ncbi:MAG: hypothetical protein WB808_09200 [Candidatus Dormiibacterota bacterium]
MPNKDQREKDPVKVAAGKKGGRPVSVNGLERLTIRVSPEFHAKLKNAAEGAKAQGRDVPMGKIVRLAIEMLLLELDAKDMLTVFLEDPDQVEVVVRPRKRRAVGSGTTRLAGRVETGPDSAARATY